jgi:hypothetical protein
MSNSIHPSAPSSPKGPPKAGAEVNSKESREQLEVGVLSMVREGDAGKLLLAPGTSSQLHPSRAHVACPCVLGTFVGAHDEDEQSLHRPRPASSPPHKGIAHTWVLEGAAQVRWS